MSTSKKTDQTNPNVVREALQQYKNDEVVNYYASNLDAFDELIFEHGLQIRAVHIYVDMDLLLIVLNNQRVIKRPISAFPTLQSATEPQLNNFELIGGGTGIHWPDIDEDLSLKGFLKEELLHAEPQKKK